MGAFTITASNWQANNKINELVLAYQERRNALVELGVITTGNDYRNWANNGSVVAFPAAWTDSATPTSIAQGTYIQGMDLFKEMQEFIKTYCVEFADITTGKEHIPFTFVSLIAHANANYAVSMTTDFTREYGAATGAGIINQGDYISETLINELVACFSAMNSVSTEIDGEDQRFCLSSAEPAGPVTAYDAYDEMRTGWVANKLCNPSTNTWSSISYGIEYTEAYGEPTAGFPALAFQDQYEADVTFPTSLPVIDASQEYAVLIARDFPHPTSGTVTEYITSLATLGVPLSIGDADTFLDFAAYITAAYTSDFSADGTAYFLIDPKFTNIGITV